MKRLLCVAALFLAVPTTAKESVPSLRDLTRATMVEGLDALDVRNYPKAQKGFLAAQALLDQRPLDGDTYEDRAVRAAVAYLTAKATGEAKLGDACPILKLARSHVDSAAVLAAKQPKIDHMREIGNEADDDIAAANVKFGCVKAPPAEKGMIPAKLAGHYYLSGVMETGSELRLKPDGAYEYYISYGSVDQFSAGTWQRIGDAVVLTPETIPANAPLFKLDSLDPWDIGAEDFAQTARYDARVKAAEALCPFLGEPVIDENTVPPPMVTTVSTPIPGAAPPKVDHALIYWRAKATEEQVRRTYERAAQVAMMPGNTNAGRHHTARGARYTWQSALDELKSARDRADFDAPLPLAPGLPAMCQVAEPRAVNEIPEKEWIRGFAVAVGDPARELRFRNVDVIFHLSDGKDVAAKTQSHGVAWVERRAGVSVTAVSLSYRGDGRDKAPFERFVIPNGTEGVQRVIVDTRQLVAPPFYEMRLIIRNGALQGPNGRGRYLKQD